HAARVRRHGTGPSIRTCLPAPTHRCEPRPFASREATVDWRSEVDVKGVRIVQVILVVVAVAYLLLFHSANPDQVELPLLPILPPIPVSFVVVLAVLVGWLFGWIPARLLAWRRGRDLRRVEKRLADL